LVTVNYLAASFAGHEKSIKEISGLQAMCHGSDTDLFPSERTRAGHT
jgi:hypothetical protein